MSTLKHTPEPWLAPKKSGDLYIWASKRVQGTKEQYVSITLAKVNVQESNHPGVGITADEAFGNAKLMAASLKLYEGAILALRELRQFYTYKESEAIRVLMDAIKSVE